MWRKKKVRKKEKKSLVVVVRPKFWNSITRQHTGLFHEALCFCVDQLGDSCHQHSCLGFILAHMRQVLWLKCLLSWPPLQEANEVNALQGLSTSLAIPLICLSKRLREERVLSYIWKSGRSCLPLGPERVPFISSSPWEPRKNLSFGKKPGLPKLPCWAPNHLSSEGVSPLLKVGKCLAASIATS